MHFIGFFSHPGPSCFIIKSMWHNMEFGQRFTGWIYCPFPHNWPSLVLMSDNRWKLTLLMKLLCNEILFKNRFVALISVWLSIYNNNNHNKIQVNNQCQSFQAIISWHFEMTLNDDCITLKSAIHRHSARNRLNAMNIFECEFRNIVYVDEL